MGTLRLKINVSKPKGTSGIIMAKTTKYSFITGLLKTAKNSAFLLIPFVLALMAGIPGEYAWVSGPIVYMLKNYYQNRNK